MIETIRDTVDSKFNSIFKKLLDKKMKYLNGNLKNSYSIRKVNKKH